MKPPTIEFASPSDVAENCAVPWEVIKNSTYQDLLIKPTYLARKARFQPGKTWIRLLPPLAGSRSWILGINSLNYEGGRHPHAKTLNSGAGNSSVFDLAYAWCLRKKPNSLYSKTNKDGYKLLSDPVFMFWVLLEENGKTVARLVIGSGYDGSRGGASGLGHQFLKLAQERDENGNLASNPAHPDSGVQICVEKTQSKDSRFPSYALRVGRVAAPISEFLEKMEPTEIAALASLKDIVNLPTPDEEWKLLEKVIDPETVAEIRAAQT